MDITDPKTQRLFSQAYILGGSPCSGKSTVAERLVSEFGLAYYRVDDYERDHIERCNPRRHPVMHQFSQKSWDDIWMRPVRQQVEEEFAFYRERFEMIVQDLQKYSDKESILLEGAALLPELLERNAADPQRVMFLVPTKAFQLHHYAQRPWITHILKDCKDPEQAFENWMARDHLFGQEVLRQAQARNYKTMIVDGTQPPDEQYAQVAAYFGLT